MRTIENAEYLKEVGMNVKVERIRQRLTQTSLAELTGLNIRTIHVLESGTDGARLETLKRVADALGKPVKHFV